MQQTGDPIKVEYLTRENIISGMFQEKLPELYNLKNVIENNSWHDNESVFDHTMTVLYMLEQMNKYAPDRIRMYLDQKLDENSQWNILYIGGILHDRGKETMLRKHEDGTTTSRGHEKIGAKLILSTLNKIFLSDQEKRIVKKIMENHGHLNNIVYLGNENLEEQYDKLMSQERDIFVELNMLAFADVLSAKPLKTNNPEEYQFRTDFYRNILNNH